MRKRTGSGSHRRSRGLYRHKERKPRRRSGKSSAGTPKKPAE